MILYIFELQDIASMVFPMCTTDGTKNMDVQLSCLMNVNVNDKRESVTMNTLTVSSYLMYEAWLKGTRCPRFSPDRLCAEIW